MAGVHGLQHVHRFCAPNLANHNAVGPHAQGVANKCPLGNFALALNIHGAGLHAHNVRLLHLQLSCIFNRHNAL